jgi:hypothetical protein
MQAIYPFIQRLLGYDVGSAEPDAVRPFAGSNEPGVGRDTHAAAAGGLGLGEDRHLGVSFPE